MFPKYLETLYLLRFDGLGCIVGDHLDSRRVPDDHAITAEPIAPHSAAVQIHRLRFVLQQRATGTAGSGLT